MKTAWFGAIIIALQAKKGVIAIIQRKIGKTYGKEFVNFIVECLVLLVQFVEICCLIVNPFQDYGNVSIGMKIFAAINILLLSVAANYGTYKIRMSDGPRGWEEHLFTQTLKMVPTSYIFLLYAYSSGALNTKDDTEGGIPFLT